MDLIEKADLSLTYDEKGHVGDAHDPGVRVKFHCQGGVSVKDVGDFHRAIEKLMGPDHKASFSYYGYGVLELEVGLQRRGSKENSDLDMNICPVDKHKNIDTVRVYNTDCSWSHDDGITVDLGKDHYRFQFKHDR